MPHDTMIVSESEVPLERWSDPVRGDVGFRTLFGAGARATDSLTAGVGEMQPGDWLGPHRHEPPELYFVLEGEGTLVVDGEEHVLRAGSAVFIPGNREHALSNTGQQTLRVFYTFPVGDFGEVDYLFSETAGRTARHPT